MGRSLLCWLCGVVRSSKFYLSLFCHCLHEIRDCSVMMSRQEYHVAWRLVSHEQRLHADSVKDILSLCLVPF